MTAIARGQIAQADYIDGLDWLERAVAVYGRCGKEVPLDLQSWQAQAECGLGDRCGGERLLSVARAMLDEGVSRDAAIAYLNYGVLMYPFDGPSAYDTALEGLDFLRTRGVSEGRGLTVANQCSGLISAGRWEEAQRSMDESQSWMQQEDDQLSFCYWWGNRAEVLTLMGRAPEALECALVADERAPLWDDLVLTIQCRATLILASALAGDEMRAIELLREFAQAPRRSGFQGYEELIPQLMRFALSCGETGLAERLIVGIEPDLPLLEHLLVTGRALLREARGERDAVTDFADAATRWHDFGVPYEEAQALLGQGRCLAALGRMPEAATPLAAAREIFARLGAKPALAETDALLQQVGLA
jgi:tetratricopeptide (TPR) repeat protein